MKNMKRMSLLSLFIAIEMVLAVVPFMGYIPLGLINATTLHIPVIIAGILLGKKEGAIVGFVFGLTSVFKNTMMPTATSFVFSPFISISGVSGGWQSLIIALVPRILIGFLAGWVYEVLRKKYKSDSITITISALIGSLSNTILVMGGIYLFFGQAYAAAMNMSFQTILGFIMGIIATNGVAEALVGALICVALCKVGKKVIHL